ncbi:MAG: LdpA C-terminal domain-containing domain [Cyanobacteria bacterium J06642_3]
MQSLDRGNWFKLICGASYQHLPAIRSLAMAYSLAGADCVDVSADKAVIASAQTGIAIATSLANNHQTQNNWPNYQKPLLMISLNDDEDPHFRKAEFNASQCPPDCSRPCETICPAQAIDQSGVIKSFCYGCGRCLPICPHNLITTRSYISNPESIATLVKEMAVEAIEIHTQAGHFEQFQRLWQVIRPLTQDLQVLAISCPDSPGVITYLRSLYKLLQDLPCPLIWQTDGRSMSGDIGAGTTHAAIRFAKKVIKANLPGHIQLAGGTNSYTVTKLHSEKMLPSSLSIDHQSQLKKVSGVAYGSYARSLLMPILAELTNRSDANNLTIPSELNLESDPLLLQKSVDKAYGLVKQLKSC